MRSLKPFPLCLVGKLVEIEWRDKDADWRKYRLLDCSEGWILVAGMPQGGAPNNTRFWVALTDVSTIMEIEKSK